MLNLELLPEAIEIQLYELEFEQPMLLNYAGRKTTLHRRQGLLFKCQIGGQLIESECAPLPLFSPESLADVTAYIKQCKTIDQLAQAPFASVQCALQTASAQATPSLDWHEVDVAGFANSERETVKVKCGRDPFEQDIENLAKLDKHLRIDCNQSWTAEQLQHCFRLLGDKVEYFEEPLAPSRDYHSLSLPFALDEQLRSNTLPEYAFDAHAWVVKPMLSGLNRTLYLANLAKQHSIKFVLSSSIESVIAIRFYHALANHLSLKSPQGLDTLALFSNGTGITDKLRSVARIDG